MGIGEAEETSNLACGRGRGGSSTVLDYAVITAEHVGSVVSMEIDDKGEVWCLL